jgi:hypothetical protein
MSAERDWRRVGLGPPFSCQIGGGETASPSELSCDALLLAVLGGAITRLADERSKASMLTSAWTGKARTLCSLLLRVRIQFRPANFADRISERS